MTSFAPVYSIVDVAIIVCKVELYTLDENITIPFGRKKTKTMYIEVNEVPEEVGTVCQGDVLVVEQDGEQITQVLYKDENEKQRRIDYLKSL